MTVADGMLTIVGEVDAVSLDVSGDADIDGALGQMQSLSTELH